MRETNMLWEGDRQIFQDGLWWGEMNEYELQLNEFFIHQPFLSYCIPSAQGNHNGRD